MGKIHIIHIDKYVNCALSELIAPPEVQLVTILTINYIILNAIQSAYKFMG